LLASGLLDRAPDDAIHGVYPKESFVPSTRNEEKCRRDADNACRENGAENQFVDEMELKQHLIQTQTSLI
jgi:hypothetical protein